MRLLKLHGSTNWRAKLGYKHPLSIDAIVHHEDWIDHQFNGQFELATIERHLEPEPFMVPPILAKVDLVAEPALGYIWTLAKDALSRADAITFIGYSLPLTDLSAQFLLRETIPSHKRASVSVVDFRTTKSGKDSLVGRYREVLPGMEAAQFDFGGAVSWVRSRLAVAEEQAV